MNKIDSTSALYHIKVLWLVRRKVPFVHYRGRYTADYGRSTVLLPNKRICHFIMNAL